MNLGYSKSVASKLQKFQREYISYEQMREMVLDTYQPFTIQWKKKDGSTARRDMFTTFGPGGRAMSGVQYWRAPYNYMIAYSNTDNGFRTIRLKDVDWIEKDNQKYYVR
jgi:hypothetical protein